MASIQEIIQAQQRWSANVTQNNIGPVTNTGNNVNISPDDIQDLLNRGEKRLAALLQQVMNITNTTMAGLANNSQRRENSRSVLNSLQASVSSLLTRDSSGRLGLSAARNTQEARTQLDHVSNIATQISSLKSIYAPQGRNTANVNVNLLSEYDQLINRLKSTKQEIDSQRKSFDQNSPIPEAMLLGLQSLEERMKSATRASNDFRTSLQHIFEGNLADNMLADTQAYENLNTVAQNVSQEINNILGFLKTTDVPDSADAISGQLGYLHDATDQINKLKDEANKAMAHMTGTSLGNIVKFHSAIFDQAANIGNTINLLNGQIQQLRAQGASENEIKALEQQRDQEIRRLNDANRSMSQMLTEGISARLKQISLDIDNGVNTALSQFARGQGLGSKFSNAFNNSGQTAANLWQSFSADEQMNRRFSVFGHGFGPRGANIGTIKDDLSFISQAQFENGHVSTIMSNFDSAVEKERSGDSFGARKLKDQATTQYKASVETVLKMNERFKAAWDKWDSLSKAEQERWGGQETARQIAQMGDELKTASLTLLQAKDAYNIELDATTTKQLQAMGRDAKKFKEINEEVNKTEKSSIDALSKIKGFASHVSSTIRSAISTSRGLLDKFGNLGSALMGPFDTIFKALDYHKEQGRARYAAMGVDASIGYDNLGDSAARAQARLMRGNELYMMSGGMIKRDEIDNFYKSLVKQVGGHYGGSPVQATQDMEQLANQLTPLKTVYGVSDSTLQQAVKTYYKDMGMSVNETGDAIAKLATAAQQANVPLESYLQKINNISQAFMKIGIDGQKASTILNNLLNRGIRADVAEEIAMQTGSGLAKFAENDDLVAFSATTMGMDPFHGLAIMAHTHDEKGNPVADWGENAARLADNAVKYLVMPYGDDPNMRFWGMTKVLKENFGFDRRTASTLASAEEKYGWDSKIFQNMLTDAMDKQDNPNATLEKLNEKILGQLQHMTGQLAASDKVGAILDGRLYERASEIGAGVDQIIRKIAPILIKFQDEMLKWSIRAVQWLANLVKSKEFTDAIDTIVGALGAIPKLLMDGLPSLEEATNKIGDIFSDKDQTTNSENMAETIGEGMHHVDVAAGIATGIATAKAMPGPLWAKAGAGVIAGGLTYFGLDKLNNFIFGKHKDEAGNDVSYAGAGIRGTKNFISDNWGSLLIGALTTGRAAASIAPGLWKIPAFALGTLGGVAINSLASSFLDNGLAGTYNKVTGMLDSPIVGMGTTAAVGAGALYGSYRLTNGLVTRLSTNNPLRGKFGKFGIALAGAGLLTELGSWLFGGSNKAEAAALHPEDLSEQGNRSDGPTDFHGMNNVPWGAFGAMGYLASQNHNDSSNGGWFGRLPNNASGNRGFFNGMWGLTKDTFRYATSSSYREQYGSLSSRFAQWHPGELMSRGLSNMLHQSGDFFRNMFYNWRADSASAEFSRLDQKLEKKIASRERLYKIRDTLRSKVNAAEEGSFSKIWNQSRLDGIEKNIRNYNKTIDKLTATQETTYNKWGENAIKGEAANARMAARSGKGLGHYFEKSAQSFLKHLSPESYSEYIASKGIKKDIEALNKTIEITKNKELELRNKANELQKNLNANKAQIKKITSGGAARNDTLLKKLHEERAALKKQFNEALKNHAAEQSKLGKLINGKTKDIEKIVESTTSHTMKHMDKLADVTKYKITRDGVLTRNKIVTSAHNTLVKIGGGITKAANFLVEHTGVVGKAVIGAAARGFNLISRGLESVKSVLAPMASKLGLTGAGSALKNIKNGIGGILGKFLTPIMGVIDIGLGTYDNMQRGGDFGESLWDAFREVAPEFAEDWLVFAAGAKLGAIGGGAIGAGFGGVGAAPGAVIGGLVGGLGAVWAKNEAVEYITDGETSYAVNALGNATGFHIIDKDKQTQRYIQNIMQQYPGMDQELAVAIAEGKISKDQAIYMQNERNLMRAYGYGDEAIGNPQYTDNIAGSSPRLEAVPDAPRDVASGRSRSDNGSIADRFMSRAEAAEKPVLSRSSYTLLDRISQSGVYNEDARKILDKKIPGFDQQRIENSDFYHKKLQSIEKSNLSKEEKDKTKEQVIDEFRKKDKDILVKQDNLLATVAGANFKESDFDEDKFDKESPDESKSRWGSTAEVENFNQQTNNIAAGLPLDEADKPESKEEAARSRAKVGKETAGKITDEQKAEHKLSIDRNKLTEDFIKQHVKLMGDFQDAVTEQHGNLWKMLAVTHEILIDLKKTIARGSAFVTDALYRNGGSGGGGGNNNPASGAAPKDELDAFMMALSGQESGGDYNVDNADGSGAHGKYQIMPDSWKAWAPEVGLAADAPQTPENQEKVARYKLGQYYEQTHDWKKVAMMWYGGPGVLNKTQAQLDAPQSWNGQPYPSINEYGDKVMARFEALKSQIQPSSDTPENDSNSTDIPNNSSSSEEPNWNDNQKKTYQALKSLNYSDSSIADLMSIIGINNENFDTTFNNEYGGLFKLTAGSDLHNRTKELMGNNTSIKSYLKAALTAMGELGSQRSADTFFTIGADGKSISFTDLISDLGSSKGLGLTADQIKQAKSHVSAWRHDVRLARMAYGGSTPSTQNSTPSRSGITAEANYNTPGGQNAPNTTGSGRTLNVINQFHTRTGAKDWCTTAADAMMYNAFFGTNLSLDEFRYNVQGGQAWSHAVMAQRYNATPTTIRTINDLGKIKQAAQSGLPQYIYYQGASKNTFNRGSGTHAGVIVGYNNNKWILANPNGATLDYLSDQELVNNGNGVGRIEVWTPQMQLPGPIQWQADSGVTSNISGPSSYSGGGIPSPGFDNLYNSIYVGGATTMDYYKNLQYRNAMLDEMSDRLDRNAGITPKTDTSGTDKKEEEKKDPLQKRKEVLDEFVGADYKPLDLVNRPANIWRERIINEDGKPAKDKDGNDLYRVLRDRKIEYDNLARFDKEFKDSFKDTNPELDKIYIENDIEDSSHPDKKKQKTKDQLKALRDNLDRHPWQTPIGDSIDTKDKQRTLDDLSPSELLQYFGVDIQGLSASEMKKMAQNLSNGYDLNGNVFDEDILKKIKNDRELQNTDQAIAYLLGTDRHKYRGRQLNYARTLDTSVLKSAPYVNSDTDYNKFGLGLSREEQQELNSLLSDQKITRKQLQKQNKDIKEEELAAQVRDRKVKDSEGNIHYTNARGELLFNQQQGKTRFVYGDYGVNGRKFRESEISTLMAQGYSMNEAKKRLSMDARYQLDDKGLLSTFAGVTIDKSMGGKQAEIAKLYETIIANRIAAGQDMNGKFITYEEFAEERKLVVEEMKEEIDAVDKNNAEAWQALNARIDNKAMSNIIRQHGFDPNSIQTTKWNTDPLARAGMRLSANFAWSDYGDNLYKDTSLKDVKSKADVIAKKEAQLKREWTMTVEGDESNPRNMYNMALYHDYSNNPFYNQGGTNLGIGSGEIKNMVEDYIGLDHEEQALGMDWTLDNHLHSRNLFMKYAAGDYYNGQHNPALNNQKRLHANLTGEVNNERTRVTNTTKFTNAGKTVQTIMAKSKDGKEFTIDLSTNLPEKVVKQIKALVAQFKGDLNLVTGVVQQTVKNAKGTDAGLAQITESHQVKS